MMRRAAVAVLLAGMLAGDALSQGGLAIHPGVLPNDIPEVSPPQGLDPWLQTEIGAPTIAGTAQVNAGILTITGQGDIAGVNDTGHFVYQDITGDRIIISCLSTLTGAETYRHTGVIVRDDTAADSKYGFMYMDARNIARFQYKASTGVGDSFASEASLALPECVKIERNAGTVSGYTGPTDTGAWTLQGSAAISFTGAVSYGAIIASGDAPSEAIATMTLPVISTTSGSAGTMQFTTSAQSVAEDATPLVLSVSRASGTSGAASIQIQNAGTGSAVAGTDFTDPGFPITLNWADADGATKTQNVTIINRAGLQGARDLDLALAAATGATEGNPGTQEVTITDVGATGDIMWQPGVYPQHNKMAGFGWTYSNIAADITNEVCPNSYVQGFTVQGNPGWYVNGANAGSPTYGGTEGGGWGFNAVDQILTALAACGTGRKYLVLSIQLCNNGGLDPSDATYQFPEFVLPLDGQGGVGTDSGNVYPVIASTQGPDAVYGYCLDLSDSDIVDVIMDTMIAYCNRYKDDDSFYGLNFTYTNSFPFAPGDIDLEAWNTAQQSILSATRTYCPTQMIRQHSDWASPNPSESTQYEEIVDTIDGTLMMNDTVPEEISWGELVHTGVVGGVDYRGAAEPFVNFWSEVETPEMCGHEGWNTPSVLWNHMRNGTDGTVPVRPTHIGVLLAAECDGITGTTDIYDWDAWKIFFAAQSGSTVFTGGADNTPRTPAYVKANICPFSRGCE